MSEEILQLRGALEGHQGWVTSLATSNQNPEILVSGSRDKSIVVWKLTLDTENVGYAQRSLLGHNHIVQDVAISQDGSYVLSASWDKSLRLWSLSDGSSMRFVGHEGDVMACDFSADNRMIVSAGRDRSIKLWNVIGEQLLSFDGPKGHNDWVTSVHITPEEKPRVISAGHDKLVKSWDVSTGELAADFVGHKNYINTAVLAPDGTLCASAGKEGVINIWNVEPSSFMYSLPGQEEVFNLAFSPSRYWLAAATASGIKIYDLQSHALREELHIETPTGKEPVPVSVTWSPDGQVLFAGYTDGVVRVWQVMRSLAN